MGEEWKGFNNEEEGGDMDYAFQTLDRHGRPKSLGWSVASLVLGIASIFTCTFGYAGIILGVLAVVFAIVSRKILGYFDAKSIGGLILGIFGAVFGVSMLIFVYTIGEDDQKYLWDIIKEMYQTPEY